MPLIELNYRQRVRELFCKADDTQQRWYGDLDLLAHRCFRTDRHAHAKPVFEAIGQYASEHPWQWAGEHRTKFLAARVEALRS